VLIALQNAFHELLNAPSLEAGVVASVRRGGDTDTNAAIAGALLGAVHGRAAIPDPWRQMILSCRAHPLRARQVRPARYWPVDALEVAERLVLASP
jgi:ADP-ribosylglycohydrolase